MVLKANERVEEITPQRRFYEPQRKKNLPQRWFRTPQKSVENLTGNCAGYFWRLPAAKGLEAALLGSFVFGAFGLSPVFLASLAMARFC
jgi:hypothetical protein